MKPIFVIEHLEPELYEWCIIEYKHISEIVGKDSLYFTNIKSTDVSKLEKYGSVFTQSVKHMNLNAIAVLDPESDVLLTKQNAAKHQYFIFGGILGDNPPRKRTTPEVTQFLPHATTYNIGKEQMSTDNAVFVVAQILKGKKFEDMQFQDTIEIPISKIQSTILPYRYPLVNGKPNISPALKKYLKKKDQ